MAATAAALAEAGVEVITRLGPLPFLGSLIFNEWCSSLVGGLMPTTFKGTITGATDGCTVFLQRGSCIYSKKSYGMCHGSYYKIFMILRWLELEFSKINVFGAF